VGCHWVYSHLWPASVGGGADLSLCFFLSGIFSWPGFDGAELRPNNHSSERGGGEGGGAVCEPSPEHLGIGEKLSQGEGVGRTPGEYRFIDG